MINVIDIVYYSHNRLRDPAQVLAKHAPSLGFADFVHEGIRFEFIIHMDHEGFNKMRGKSYTFFRSRNRFWYIPFKTHRYVKGKNPDFVIVEGLEFPLQLMFLRFTLGKKCRILAQHHGEKPFSGIKGFFQRMADKYISAYLFTSSKNASAWIDKKIIKNPGKCSEVLEASTHFKRMDRSMCQARLGLKGNYNFLWVGRLNSNKDPVTVLKAFRKFGLYHPDTRLYMIFQEQDLLEEIKSKIRQSVVLEDSVKLIGKVDHSDLVYWYSAANFYVSASHKEGSGYALLEAMACGCIPVVTSIPSFEKITSLGRYGFLFPPGDEDALVQQLEKLKTINIESFRQKVETRFRENLSFKSIADSLGQVISQL
jgi:glycosyltransferase involved in cell wall biosynthesis